MPEFGSLENISKPKSDLGFKQAAASGDVNVSKVIKDISSIFSTQGKNIAEVTGATQEVSSKVQQLGAKLDTNNNLLQESLNTQTQMLGEMKLMKSSLKGLFDYFVENGGGAAGGLGGVGTQGVGGALGGAAQQSTMAFRALVGGAAAIAGTGAGAISGAAGSGAAGARAPDDIKNGIRESARALGVKPEDLATVISYETGGTFDPTKAGPTTQYGQHRGLIQFGEPQARQYGVDWDNPVGSQLGENGAIVKYLKQAGVQPGMGLMDIYSAVNAGRVGRYNASDANNGGAPGTVADKVNNQMSGHKANAAAMFSEDPSARPTEMSGSTAPLGDLAEPYQGGQMRNGMIPDSQLQSIGQGNLKAQPAAADAFKVMAAAAAADGVNIKATDAYRTFDEQVDVKRRKGRMAATPGRSNHGWGLAFDINVGGGDQNNPTFKWLTENAARFGFKGPLSNPYEPWHWEFNGQGATKGGNASSGPSGANAGPSTGDAYTPQGQTGGSAPGLQPQSSIFPSAMYSMMPPQMQGAVDFASGMIDGMASSVNRDQLLGPVDDRADTIQSNAREEKVEEARPMHSPRESGNNEFDEIKPARGEQYRSSYNRDDDRNLFGEGDWVKDIFGAFGIIAAK